MRSGNDKGRVPKRNSEAEEASNVAEILDGMFFTKDEHNAGFSRAWKPVIDGKIQLERPSISNVSGSSDIKKDDDGNDSDSEIRRVPELLEKSKPVHSSRRKRTSTSSNDKEGKRLKRLLRNRVSAQQARERKKAYLIELERKAKDLEARNAELEEKNATLQRENYMLRQIVKNTTMRGGDMES